MNNLIASKLPRRISLRQLQVFEVVGRQLSFTRAVQELHLTQPTVSMQLKKLESDVGLPLTEQIGKRVSLTDAGSALYGAARDSLETLGRFEMEIDDRKVLRTGQSWFDVVTTADYFAPRLLGKFCSAWPGIKVALEVTNRAHILARMASNLDDLYLIGKPPESSDLEFRPYRLNPMVVVAPAGHRLAGRNGLSIADIADEYFIVRERGSGTRIALERQFAAAGHALRIRMELGSNESIKQGIKGGAGHLRAVAAHADGRGYEGTYRAGCAGLSRILAVVCRQSPRQAALGGRQDIHRLQVHSGSGPAAGIQGSWMGPDTFTVMRRTGIAVMVVRDDGVIRRGKARAVRRDDGMTGRVWSSLARVR